LQAGSPKPILKTTEPAPLTGETNQDLINFEIHMQKNGLSNQTIISRIRGLKQLAGMTNLQDPEQVKTTISQQTWKSQTKRKIIENYNALLKFLGKTWTKPRTTIEEKIPFIPTETEIDLLIASCGKRTGTLLQTLKETASRISEATKLKWTDLSTEQKTINITPSKGSNPRLLRISDKLLNMLNQLPHTKETIFPTDIDSLRTTFTKQRKIASQRLQNPRIQQISFHTFRHWKATMEYHKTKDIVHVKYFLGHKNIKNTMIYINIEQTLFLEQTDQWTCKTATNTKEDQQLIEAGFEYITERDGLKLYRKRK
jgi:integrase